MNESSARSHPDSGNAASAIKQAVADLDFPDWSGQRRHVSRANLSDLLRYCEAMLPLVKSKPGRAERRRRLRVYAEFRL